MALDCLSTANQPCDRKGARPCLTLEIHDVILNGIGETEERSLFNDCNGL